MALNARCADVNALDAEVRVATGAAARVIARTAWDDWSDVRRRASLAGELLSLQATRSLPRKRPALVRCEAPC